MPKAPTILITSTFTSDYAGTAGHCVRDTYVRAIVRASNCTPLIMPVIGPRMKIDDFLPFIDGVVLTGASSNVSPAAYGQERQFEAKYLEVDRDSMVLPMLRKAVEVDLPVFAICRGFQELNVACGGTLHQFLHRLPGKLDHRQKKDLTMLENFHNHAHGVQVQPGGLFQKWDMPSSFEVNSLHAQGVDKVGDGLYIEATSQDGVVEAVSMPGKKFILGVQWHPEGNCFIDKQSHKLFEKFGLAVHAAAQ